MLLVDVVESDANIRNNMYDDKFVLCFLINDMKRIFFFCFLFLLYKYSFCSHVYICSMTSYDQLTGSIKDHTFFMPPPKFFKGNFF